jgi:hypothetical protein
MTFWVWYDYMGIWFILNLCAFIPILLSVPFIYNSNLTFIFKLLLLPIFCFYIYFTNVFISSITVSILEHRYELKNTIVEAIRIAVCKSLPIGLIYILLFGVFFVNVYFYSVYNLFNLTWINYFLIVLFVWLILFTFISLMWTIPSLIFKKMNVIRYIPWGYMLFFANPYFSFLTFFWYTILYLLNTIPVYFFFVGMVIPSVFITCAYEILSENMKQFRINRLICLIIKFLGIMRMNTLIEVGSNFSNHGSCNLTI